MKRATLVMVLVGCGDSSGAPDAREYSVVDVVIRAEPEPPAGLAAWFPLNNSTQDATGLNDMGCGGPLATFFGEGYHSQGAYMDGHSQRAMVFAWNTTRLDFPGPFSVAAWVRLEEVPPEYGVIASRSYGTGTESSFAVVVDSSLRLRYDSQGDSSLAGTTPLVVNEWTHVALTFDGTTKRIYRNGVLDASGPAAAPVTWEPGYVVFGADEGATETMSNHPIRGAMDDLMLFDREVSAAEWAAFAAQ